MSDRRLNGEAMKSIKIVTCLSCLCHAVGYEFGTIGYNNFKRTEFFLVIYDKMPMDLKHGVIKAVQLNY